MKNGSTKPVPLTRVRLRRQPLPLVKEDDDKEDRGRVLVIGGSRRVPGAILLSGAAALLAGAGKLQLATVEDASIPLGVAMPEALVLGLPRNRRGEIHRRSATRELLALVERADAILVGPGMGEGACGPAFIRKLISRMKRSALLVLDGSALAALSRSPDMLRPLKGRAILTPHRLEMAGLLDENPNLRMDQMAASKSARRYGATVVFKGSTTWLAEPDGTTSFFSGACAGLGTSGSGDTLAGIIAGLAARGASPNTAASWGVWTHGNAGQRVARRIGRIGFLARDLLPEIPVLIGTPAE